MAKELFKILTPILDPSISAHAVDPQLPDHDPNPNARARQLEAARRGYQWDWTRRMRPACRC